MQNYYVFLDLDGVMWDFKSLKETKYFLSKKSINAINFLLEEIQKNYNPTLVITSLRRIKKDKIKQRLIDGGVNLNCDFEITPIKLFKSRAYEIKEYLKDKEDKNNFVIIDDIKSLYSQYFGADKLIKTSLIKGCLDENKIKDYLNGNTI